MLAILLAWIPLCAVVGYAASQKGRSGAGFFFLSLFFSPLIGILVVIAMPSTVSVGQAAAAASPRGADLVLCHSCRRPRRADSYRCLQCGAGAPDPHAGQKKCAACAEWILRDALKCRYCGEAQAIAPVPQETRPHAWKKVDEIEQELGRNQQHR